MIIYDLIHGYQPFDSSFSKTRAIPKWVKKNLKDIFLPTSLAMKKGLIPRGVQVQGWTIDSWINTKKTIKILAKKTLNNLKIANKKGNIDIGISAYSHPILPVLSNDLVKAQIILDRETVEQYLGKAKWFWFPEGAINQRVLKIVHQTFPDLILLIPDKSLKIKNFNGPIKIKFLNNSEQKAIVFSVLFKNLFMNAEDYRKKRKYESRPKYLPKDLVWAQVRRAVYSFQSFQIILNYFGKNDLVLMRDWENGGSKKGLKTVKGITYKNGVFPKDIGVFLRSKQKLDFYLPSQYNWQKSKIVLIREIKPATWDIESSIKDPFPWWQPNKNGRIWREYKRFRQKKIIKWQELIKEFDVVFQQKIKQQGGLKKALNNLRFKKLLKQTFPALHSCVGWHYSARRAWRPNYQYSEQALKNIVLPCLERLKLWIG